MYASILSQQSSVFDCMSKKIKTKFLIVLLGVYLATFFAPVSFSITDKGYWRAGIQVVSAAPGAGDFILKPSEIEWRTSIPNNFIRITKDGRTADGKPVVLAPNFTLNKAGSAGKIGFDTSPGYYIDAWGSGDYFIEELRVVAVNSLNLSSACRDVATDDCDVQYESPSDYFEERTLNVGEAATFYLELTPAQLNAFGLVSSPSGAINQVSVFPRIFFSAEFFDQDFPQAAATYTIQVYDTLEQLQAASATPPPPGAGGGSEGTGSGTDSPVNNKLKDCFTSLDAVFCLINLFLGAIGGLLEQFIKVVWSWIISPVLSTALSVRTYEDKFANVIYPAWIILRNLTNIAFILAIIAMGVATVFRISGWMVRDLMIKLIIGAFLVNFSLVIPQAILGIAETIQNQFLSIDSGAVNAISNELLSFTLFDNSTVNLGSFSETIRIFMNFWTMLFGFIAFCAILFIVVVRLVVIWILLMCSPLIYAAYIFPATRSFFNKWWSTFMKWAFITAAVGFMLNLTAIVTFQSRGLLVGLSGVDQTTLGGNTAVAYEFMTQLIPIVFLYATVKVATSMGSGINSFVDKTLAKGASLGTAVGAGMLTYGALKPAQKLIYEPAKDKLQTSYLNQVAKLRPKQGEKGTTKGFFKRQAFDVLSGFAYSKSKEEYRKKQLSSAQKSVKIRADDHRNLVKGYALTADYSEHAERVSEAEKDILRESEETTKKDIEGFLDRLQSGEKLSDVEQAYLEAKLIKAQKQKKLNEIIKARFGGDITQMYSLINNAGKDVEESQSRAKVVANKLNSGYIESGKYQFVVDAEKPHDSREAEKKKKVILNSRSAEELAQVDPASFQATTGTNPNTREYLADFIMNFKNPALASELSQSLSPDRKSEYKNMLNDGITMHELKSAVFLRNNSSNDIEYMSPGGRRRTITIDELFNNFRASL